VLVGMRWGGKKKDKGIKKTKEVKAEE